MTASSETAPTSMRTSRSTTCSHFRFVDFNFRMIPKYWEEPELLDGYMQM